MHIEYNSSDAEPSTVCPACREWERDMNGTLATLQRERETMARLLDELRGVTRTLKAFSYTNTLGRNQRERLDSATALIAKLDGTGKP